MAGGRPGVVPNTIRWLSAHDLLVAIHTPTSGAHLAMRFAGVVPPLSPKYSTLRFNWRPSGLSGRR